MAGSGRTVRVIIALTAVSACLGAAAYAATRPERATTSLAGSKPVRGAPQHWGHASAGDGEEALPRPVLIEYPEAISAVAETQFRFHVPPRTQGPINPTPQSAPSGEPTSRRRFQCRLDDGDWRACSSPYRLAGLLPGGHYFAVRAFNRAGRPGPAVSYSWRQVEASSGTEEGTPKPFSIELQSELGHLYPGDPVQPVPIRIVNPNPVPIEVTSVTVAIASEPPNCSAANFLLTPSSAAPTAPLTVPAHAAVGLPTPTTSAPAIGMLNLPVNQDPCRGVDVPLVFAGEAHG
jgi:hypothetical protein